MTPLGYAWQRTAPHWKLWTGGAILRTVFRLLPLQVPIVAGWMINRLGQSPAAADASLAAQINQFGLALAGLAALTGFSAYGSVRLRKQLENQLDGALQHQVWNGWQSAAPSFRASFGLDRFTTQTLPYCSAAGDLAGECAMEGLAAAARMAYPILMLLLIDPWLALLPLGLLPLQAMLSHLATNHGQRHAASEREARRKAKKLMAHSLAGADTIQTLSAQTRLATWIEDAQQRFEAAKEAKRKYERVLSSAVWGIAALALALSWWVGAHRVASGALSLGQLVTFAGFVGFLALPLRSFSRIFRKFRNALDRLGQVREFLLAADTAVVSKRHFSNLPEGVVLQMKNVSCEAFGSPVLAKVSAVFPGGEFIWVRGRSGCGKTTFLQLLAGLETPAQGSVVASAGPIALVQQHSEIFPTSLRANLLLAQPKASEAEIFGVLEGVGLLSLVENQKQGLAAVVGEDLRLNAGERQRLALARALLRNPKVLLLDESLSALDEEVELQILNFLAKQKPHVTIILVAHQVRSLSAIDRVMELRDGQLHEWATQYKQLSDERE